MTESSSTPPETVNVSLDDWEGLDTVHEATIGEWRHGSVRENVFRRDGHLYRVEYRTQPRHGMSECVDWPLEAQRVVAREKIVTYYPLPRFAVEPNEVETLRAKASVYDMLKVDVAECVNSEGADPAMAATHWAELLGVDGFTK